MCSHVCPCHLSVDMEAKQQENGASLPPLPSAPENPVHSPSLPAPIKCSLGAKPCHDGTDCVLYSHICDGELDCKDGSDEDECSTTCQTSNDHVLIYCGIWPDTADTSSSLVLHCFISRFLWGKKIYQKYPNIV